MATIYRIKGWNQYFENDRTRRVEGPLRRIMVPNKHDGEGYKTIMAEPDGIVIYGCWHLILQVASKCWPRGTLTREDGTPHTAKSISIKSGWRNAQEIQRALDFCSSQEVGWIEAVDSRVPSAPPPSRPLQVPAPDEDIWSRDEVVKHAASPDCGVPAEMALACFDHYAAAGWHDGNGNKVARTVNSLKALLRKWKTRQPSHEAAMRTGNGHLPDAQPKRKLGRREAFERAVQDLVPRLLDAKGDAEFKRQCSVAADKYRDLGKGDDGKDVVGQAIEIVQFRREHEKSAAKPYPAPAGSGSDSGKES